MDAAQNTATATDTTESIRALEAFVVDNPELSELESLVGRFNVFDALRIVRAELRHSNFLAWLLDPAESHGLGQLFLRVVLMDMLRDAPAEHRPLSPVDLDGFDLGGVEVRREWQNVDMLIVAQEPRVVVAVENKIDSGEHSNQLKRYRQAVTTAFPEHRALYVFLTREGDEPSDPDWITYDYARLHDALTRCVDRHGEAIGPEVRVFLDHYTNTIRSHFMQDEEIDRLCETIYRKHRQALDLIIQRVGDPRTAAITAVRKKIESLPDALGLRHVRGSGNRFVFTSTTWHDALPEIGEKPNAGPAWLGWEAHAAPRGSLHLRLVVGPTADPGPRERLIQLFDEHADTLGTKRNTKVIGPVWCRVDAVKLLKNIVDAEEATVEKAISRGVERVRTMTPKIAEFLHAHRDELA